MDYFEGMFNNSNGHQFFTAISSVHHERVGESLNDWALRLAEPFRRVSPSRVGQVLCILFFHGNVILSINNIIIISNYPYVINNKISYRLTWRDMSDTWTSSHDHLLKSLISGSSAGAGA